jgi:hypothetical protein
MKSSSFLIFIFIGEFFLSCSVRKDRNSPIVLIGNEVLLDTTSSYLQGPKHLFILDSILIIRNGQYEKDLFSLVDIRNNKVLTGFGKSGEALGDFPPTGFAPHTSRHPRCLEFYGFSLGGRVNVDSVMSGSRRTFSTIFQVNKEPVSQQDFFNKEQIFKVTNIDDTVFVVDGILGGNKRLAIANNKGVIKKAFFEYPRNGNVVDARYYPLGYARIFATHPTEHLLVNAYLDSDWLEILQVKDNELEIVHSEYTFLPNFRSNKDGSIIGSISNIVGNMSINATDHLIFVLRSEKKIKDLLYGNEVHLSGNEVFVYDWSGNKITVLKLDRDVAAFDVDDNGKFILAISNDLSPKLFKYDLPELE